MHLFRVIEKYNPQTEPGPSQRASAVQDVVWLVFIGWIFHMLLSGRIIAAIIGKRWRFPGIVSSCTPWSFDSDWNCHGASGCFIILAD